MSTHRGSEEKMREEVDSYPREREEHPFPRFSTLVTNGTLPSIFVVESSRLDPFVSWTSFLILKKHTSSWMS